MRKKEVLLSLACILTVIFIGIVLLQNVSAEKNDEWRMEGHDSTRARNSTSNIPERIKIGWTFEEKGNKIIPPEPIISEGMVFVKFSSGKLYALYEATGEEVWNMSPQFSNENIAVSDGKIFCYSYGKDAELAAVNMTDKNIIWQEEMQVKDLVVYENKLYFVGHNESEETEYIRCFNPDNGEEYWRKEYDNSSNIAVSDGKVVSSRYSYNISGEYDDYHIFCLSATDGKELWNLTTNGGRLKMAIDNKMVFYFEKDNEEKGFENKQLVSLNLSDGGILWKKELDRDDYEWHKFGLGYEKIFLNSDDKTIAFNQTDGEIAWEKTMEKEGYDYGGTSCIPVIADGRVLFNVRFYEKDNHENAIVTFYQLNESDGNIIKTYDIVHEYSFSYTFTIPANGKIFIFADKLYVLEDLGPIPDLSVSEKNITFSKKDFLEEEIVIITATIENIGFKNATNITVRFLVNDVLIMEDFISKLDINSTKNLSIEWRATYGEHTISVVIDPNNEVEEMDEINNVAEKIIKVNPLYFPCLASNTTQKSANPEGFIDYNLTIKNIGGKEDTIYLSTTNPQDWLVFLNKTAFFLQPNESQNVTLTEIVPGNAQANENVEISVLAQSFGNSSREDILVFESKINQVHKALISINQTNFNINPNQELNLNLTLENLGNGNDIFKNKINETKSKIPKYWNYTKEKTTKSLDIFQKDFLIFNIKPPKNETANTNANFVFEVTSTNLENVILDSKTITIKVNQIHNISLDPEKTEFNTNPGEEVNCIINITNNGNGNETIILELSGKNNNWGYLNLSQINLGIDITKKIELTVEHPDYAVARSQAEIEIQALSSGKIFYSPIIVTTQNQTHSVSIDLIGESSKNVNPSETVEYQIKIKNNGNGEEQIELKLSGENSDWGEIEKEVFLEIGEEKTIKLKVTIPNNVKTYEKAKIIISAYFVDEFLDSIETNTLVKQIYEVALETIKNKEEVKPGESLEYKIKITNKGNGKDTIRIELSGLNSNWGWFDESVFVLNENESKTISLTVKPPSSAIQDEKAVINILSISEDGTFSNTLKTTTTIIILESNPPKSQFKILQDNKEVSKVKIGERITFDASSSSNDEGKIIKYIWDFGNGEIRYDEVVNYAYPEDTKPGKYIITLNVTDSEGITSEKQMTIDVLEEKEESNWLLYLILVVIIVVGLIIVIMLAKVVKTLKHLGEVKKPIIPITEKVGMSTLGEEKRRKEELKNKEIEMWKPHEIKEEKPELINITKENEEIKEKEDREEFNEKKLKKKDEREENEDINEPPKESEEINEKIKEEKTQEEDMLKDLEKIKEKKKENDADWWEKWEASTQIKHLELMSKIYT